MDQMEHSHAFLIFFFFFRYNKYDLLIQQIKITDPKVGRLLGIL